MVHCETLCASLCALAHFVARRLLIPDHSHTNLLTHHPPLIVFIFIVFFVVFAFIIVVAV